MHDTELKLIKSWIFTEFKYFPLLDWRVHTVRELACRLVGEHLRVSTLCHASISTTLTALSAASKYLQVKCEFREVLESPLHSTPTVRYVTERGIAFAIFVLKLDPNFVYLCFFFARSALEILSLDWIFYNFYLLR